ncbi:MAG: PAS domain S-box protein, partial [Pseudomonadota bacterium]
MKGKESLSQITSDISVLYELSLAVGQSLDFKTNCDRFLKTMMARKNLGYASVWIKGEYLVDIEERNLPLESINNLVFLVYANPQFRIRETSLPLHHPVFSSLDGKEAFSISSSEKGFSKMITERGIEQGAFAIFSLGKFGFLKLFSMARERPFKEEELSQLKNVISKFVVSLEGCIAHQKLIWEITERKRAEEKLRESEERFRDLYDNAPIGYREYDIEGRITNVNQTDLDMLGYSREGMVGQYMWKFNVEEETAHEQIMEKLAGKRPPGRGLERTYRRKDGTTIPVLIEDRLILDEKGQIKGIRCTIQDITGIKQTEEALRRSEKASTQLAQENAVVAEIGRIISSSLNIDEVYERFTKEVAKLISFDRIMINIVNPENNTTSFAYIAGIDVPERRVKDITPLKGTATFECMLTRSSMLIQPENIDECLARFPALLPTFQAGLRSIIFVPMISKDQFIGALSLRSLKPKAYTDQDVRLAKSIANQIAGAIANAQLFSERQGAEEALQRSEESAKRIAQENAVMAEIGKIISSSLNIDEVYERFTKEVAELISFDRIVINIVDIQNETTATPYAAGIDVPGRQIGIFMPLAGTATEECFRTRSSMLIQPEDIDECLARFPALLPTFQAGLRSIIFVPMISKDQFIGALSLRSLKPKAYTDQDV